MESTSVIGNARMFQHFSLHYSSSPIFLFNFNVNESTRLMVPEAKDFSLDV